MCSANATFTVWTICHAQDLSWLLFQPAAKSRAVISKLVSFQGSIRSSIVDFIAFVCRQPGSSDIFSATFQNKILTITYFCVVFFLFTLYHNIL